MARGRMLSRSLSTSRRFAALQKEGGDLTDFASGLYILLILHADDYGRLAGDPWTVKQVVLPFSPRDPDEFAQALAILARVQLVQKYDVNGQKYLYITKFERHQRLKFRVVSEFPAPPFTPSNGKKRREEKRSEEKRSEGDLYDTLRACPHTPRCINLPLCRRITQIDQAMRAGTVTAEEGAAHIKKWRKQFTMARATLHTAARVRAGKHR